MVVKIKRREVRVEGDVPYAYYGEIAQRLKMQSIQYDGHFKCVFGTCVSSEMSGLRIYEGVRFVLANGRFVYMTAKEGHMNFKKLLPEEEFISEKEVITNTEDLMKELGFD